MNCINYLKTSILFVFLLFGSATITFSNDFGSVSPVKSDCNVETVECDEIEVTLDITNTTDNQQNGKIVLNFKKSTPSYTSFIFSGNSQDNRFDIKDNQASDLAKGEYNLYIQNKTGCTKHVKFKIN
jgi:hypothetical protein